jgi:hypothetical protein
VTGLGPDLATAAERSRWAAEAIRFDGKQYRRDIGWRELAAWRPARRPDMPELPEAETIVRDLRARCPAASSPA